MFFKNGFAENLRLQVAFRILFIYQLEVLCIEFYLQSVCESVFAYVRESDKMRKRERKRIVATQGFGCQFGSKIFDNFFLIATRLWLLQASDRMLFVAWFEKKTIFMLFSGKIIMIFIFSLALCIKLCSRKVPLKNSVFNKNILSHMNRS